MKISKFKRFSLIVLVLAFVLTCSIALVACGEDAGDNNLSREYFVTIHPNNGAEDIKWNTKEELPTITKEGYVIEGVYLDSDFTQSISLETYKETGLNEDIDVYIKWTQEECKHLVIITDKKKDPTCTETGLTEGSHCAACNMVIVAQQEISALDHDKIHHDKKDPTCTEIGWDAYDTCSRCEYTTYVEKSALNHNYGDVTYTWSADNKSCTATRTCARVNTHIETETVSSIATVTQTQSCTNKELTKYEATFINSAFKKQVKENVETKAALNHNYEFSTIVWTDYTAKAVYICSRDNNHKDEQDCAITNEVTKAPTCVATGTKTYTATYDGHTDTKDETLDKDSNNHDLVHHNAKAPTCTEIGWDAYDTCSRCSYTTYVEKSALNHNYGEVTYTWSADNKSCTATRTCSNDSSHIETETVSSIATVTQTQSCTNKELTKYEATFTNSAFTKQVKENVETKAALNHNYEFSAIVWTDYTAKAIYVCSRDNNHKEEKDCAITNKVTLAPTCVATGTKTYTATYDGHTDTKEETLGIDSNNHNWDTNWTVDKDPKCKETGSKSHHCSLCSSKKDETEVPSLGHNYQDDICTRCEDELQTKGLSFAECTINEVEGYSVSIGTASGDICIPSEYNNNKLVIKIVDFKNSTITGVVVPDSVTSMDSSAFSGCTSLKAIKGPSSIVKSITNDCGSSSYSLEITSGTIGNTLFKSNTGINALTIGDGVTSIGLKSFEGCSGLTNITIGNGVKSVGNYAFYNCKNVKEIIIGNKVKSIGDYAFYMCNYVKEIIIPDSVTEIGGYAFCVGASGNFRTLKIGSGVTTIGSGAFFGSENLTGLYIKDLAQWCRISFGDGDANPLRYATYLYVNGIQTTNIKIPQGITSIKRIAFYGYKYLSSVTIPDSVTSIGSYAFQGCSGLTSVEIPKGVKSIEDSAFQNCTNLNRITISDTVTSIGTCAFYNCPNLESIIIPDGVTAICATFYGCTNLESITIPDTVTSIQGLVFYNCSELTSITFNGTKAQWEAISKDTGWNTNTGTYTIHCKDGDISK